MVFALKPQIELQLNIYKGICEQGLTSSTISHQTKTTVYKRPQLLAPTDAGCGSNVAELPLTASSLVTSRAERWQSYGTSGQPTARSPDTTGLQVI